MSFLYGNVESTVSDVTCDLIVEVKTPQNLCETIKQICQFYFASLKSCFCYLTVVSLKQVREGGYLRTKAVIVRFQTITNGY